MALTKITQTLVETGAIGSSQIASGAIGAGHLTNITTNHITEGNSNQFFTTARARSSLSGSTGVTYNSSTGAISIGQSVGTSDSVTFGQVTVDTITINTSEIATSGNMILNSASDVILDADGGNVMLKDNSVWFGNFNHNGNNLAIDAKIQDGDIKFRGNDGGTVITALTLDMSDGGAAIFNNDIYLSDNRAARFGDDQDLRIYNDGNHSVIHNSTINQDILFKGNDDGSPITALTLDMSNAGKATFAGIVSSTTGLETGNMFVTANEIDVSSGDLTLDVAGNIILNADGSTINLMDDTVNFGSLFSTGAGNFNIYSPTLNQDIKFLGNDGGSTVTALTLDMSNAGKATFNSDVVVGGDLIVNGTQTVLNTATLTVEDKIITVANGAADAAAANESGITVDGATAQILYKSTNDRWELNKEVFSAFGFMIGTTSTDVGLIRNNAGVFDFQAQSGRQISFSNATNGEFMRIDADGDVGIGVTPATNSKLTIGGTKASYSSVLSFDNNTAGGATFFMLASDNTWNAGSNKFFMGHGSPSSSAVDMTIDADGRVGIKNTSPAATLEVGTLTSGSTGNVIINSEGGNPPALQVKSRTNRARINIQDNDTSGYIIAEDSVISIGFADQVSDNNININSSHDVGIGTDTPIAKLHIQDNTSTVYDETAYQHDLFIEKRNTAGNNQVGTIRFGVTGHDGSTTAEASIGVLQTANAHSGNIVFGTRDSGNRAERMRITSNGNVGIGTDSPYAGTGVTSLTVNADSYPVLSLQRAGTNVGQLVGYWDHVTLFASGSRYLAFDINGSERMRLDTSGNLSLRQNGAASTNSVNMPPHFEFKGQGWDSNSGSDDMNAKIEMAATYGKVGSGATSPELVFSLQGAGGLDSSSEAYVEAMRLVGAGAYNYNEPRLGVGTASPSKRFEVYSNVNTGGAQITGGTSAANISLHINNTASNGENWNISSTGGGHGYGDGQLQFGVAYGVPKMSIMSNGNVGIGAFSSANPITPLHVLGNATIETGSPDLYFATTNATHNNWRVAAQETIDKGFEIASGTQSAASNAVNDTYTTRFVIKDSGNVGIGSHIPDAKLHIVEGNNYAKFGDLNGNSTMSLRMADSTNYPVEIQAYGSDLKLRTTTSSGGSPQDRIIVMAVTGHVGINNVDPNFLMHINKKSGSYFHTPAGVIKSYFGVNTDYNTNGSQGIYLSHLDGNWIDGTSGGDSQYGMLFGYENSVRGGLIYDHRGSEMMSLWSSYAPIRFMTPDAADGNGVPLDSNINDRLHIAVGGNVGVNTSSPQKTLHVNSGATNVVARFESTDGIAAIEFKDPSGTGEIGCSGNNIYFYPAGVAKASIDAGGKFETEGNIKQNGGTSNYIDTGGRVTGKVQDMINIGGDNWSHLPRYYGNFGYGTGGQLSGYSVSMQDGQNSSWYAGLTFTGYVTWLPDVYIPYALGQVYGMSASFFQHANNTAGTAVQYVGCVGYDANFNFMGHDAIGTYQYNMASSATFTAGTVTELDVTLKGWQGSGQSNGNKMDRGTVYIRPMMLINYPWNSSSGGTTPSTTVLSFTMGPKHTFSDNDSNAGTNY